MNQWSAEFKDREREREEIETCDPPRVLTCYGVRGVGKTRLLKEVQAETEREQGLAILIDMAQLEAPLPESLLRAAATAMPDPFRLCWDNLENAAESLVSGLGAISQSRTVLMMLDTTESIQQEDAFWRWIEAHLLGPMIARTAVRLVSAGRVPAPWRRFEVRRAVRLMSLDALPVGTSGRELMDDLLSVYNAKLGPADKEEALPMLLSLSHGHPLLSERLAAHAAPRLPGTGAGLEELERELRETIIGPFVEEDLFGEIEAPWPEILTWASVLDEFDLLTLEKYLRRLCDLGVLDKTATSQPPHFWNQGIAHMRNRFALVFRTGQGYAVHGILREIVSEQARAMDPAQYAKARRAARETYEWIAEELGDSPEAQAYRDKAAQYTDSAGIERREDTQ